MPHLIVLDRKAPPPGDHTTTKPCGCTNGRTMHTQRRGGKSAAGYEWVCEHCGNIKQHAPTRGVRL